LTGEAHQILMMPFLIYSPGRFFAANQLKALLAHTLMAYEVKLENEGRKPEDMWIADVCLPNPTARIMFRARQG
jgi:hypothetical protein